MARYLPDEVMDVELPRRRWKGKHRPTPAPGTDPDLSAVRYYIYWLRDNDGRVVYIGRSYNPLGRLLAHHSAGREWASRVTNIDAKGPYSWDEACRLERAAILKEKPPGNRQFVTTAVRPPLPELS